MFGRSAVLYLCQSVFEQNTDGKAGDTVSDDELQRGFEICVVAQHFWVEKKTLVCENPSVYAK